MKKISKKLAFSATTVRQLQHSMSEEDLQAVGGGTLTPTQTGGLTGGGGAIPTMTTLITRSISGNSKMTCDNAC